MVKPEITHEVDGEITVHDPTPPEADTKYEVAPVTRATVTVADPLAATAEGAPEAARAMTALDAAEGLEDIPLAIAEAEKV